MHVPRVSTSLLSINSFKFFPTFLFLFLLHFQCFVSRFCETPECNKTNRCNKFSIAINTLTICLNHCSRVEQTKRFFCPLFCSVWQNQIRCLKLLLSKIFGPFQNWTMFGAGATYLSMTDTELSKARLAHFKAKLNFSLFVF